jgi:very-short-patch-repair endonuclease
VATKAGQRSKKGEVLVAIMNDRAAWKIVREQGWYRIPVKEEDKTRNLKWLAFYQTKVFGSEAFAVRYFGKVSEVRRVSRRELFPDEPSNEKSGRFYFQIFIDGLEELAEPVPCLRRRMIVFIRTTMYQLTMAEEINDLFGESPLEEAMWKELKRLRIPAERQFWVEHENQRFALDFAVFCRKGNIDIETDGGQHYERAQVDWDADRNNTMAALGYTVLRFNAAQVRERMADYCVPKIVKTVKRLGGLEEDGRTPRLDKGLEQGRLFED